MVTPTNDTVMPPNLDVYQYSMTESRPPWLEQFMQTVSKLLFPYRAVRSITSLCFHPRGHPYHGFYRDNIRSIIVKMAACSIKLDARTVTLTLKRWKSHFNSRRMTFFLLQRWKDPTATATAPTPREHGAHPCYRSCRLRHCFQVALLSRRIDILLGSKLLSSPSFCLSLCLSLLFSLSPSLPPFFLSLSACVCAPLFTTTTDSTSPNKPQQTLRRLCDLCRLIDQVVIRNGESQEGRFQQSRVTG